MFYQQSIAEEYDHDLEALIPYYPLFSDTFDELLTVILHKKKNVRALDLGAGTGHLAFKLLSRENVASVCAVDSSTEMLDVLLGKASTNIAWESRVQSQIADITSDKDWKTLSGIVRQMDLVVSGYVFHHFDEETRKLLYNRICSAMKPGAVLINLDLVSAGHSEIAELFLKQDIHFIEQRFNEQLSELDEPDTRRETEMRRDEWLDHYRVENRPISIEADIRLLHDAGARRVSVPIRIGQNAIVVASK